MAAEQKTNAVNTFENGMNTDIHPIRIDNKTLRYARNIDFITAGTGSQLILQKRDGNSEKISSFDDISPIALTSGYKPVAIAEMNNVLYIVSYNNLQNKGEIGSYPSPDYSGSSNDMLDIYAPFNNYSYDDINFDSPFRTNLLNFYLDGFVDMRLQPSYDGSINIILTDDRNPVRIFNSRFAVDETGQYAELIQRRTGSSTNSYSDAFFNHTELIPRTSSVAKLDFRGVIDGGSLTAGGYRYFFRYVDSDGAVTDLIEESRLVSLHIGNSPESAHGQKAGKNTNKSVKFTLSNLDKAYYGIKVYYTISVGEIDPVTEGWEITTPFKINGDTGICNIVHTGYESVAEYNKEELSNSYSLISNCKTLTTTNDRLLLANTESEFSSELILDTISSQLLIQEDLFDIFNSNIPGLEVTGTPATKNYANAEFEYNQTGFWKGETYELGIVYTTDGGNSPVYPVQGMDRLNDSFGGVLTPYPTLVENLKQPGDNEFDALTGLNSRGVYRTASNGNLFTIEGNYMKFNGTKLKVDISPLLVDVTELPDNYLSTNDTSSGASGWSIVYNPNTRKYYLWGTVTGDFSGTVANLTDNVFNPQNIPNPSRTIFFGPVSITSDGRVIANGLEVGREVGNEFGPPIDIKNITTGFFFVRRKRMKDKVVEGITIPTAAFPTATKSGIEEEFGFPGNWTGCGTTSVGSPTVLAPVPSLCFPYGTAEAYDENNDEDIFADYLDYSGNPTVVTEAAIVDASLPQYDGLPAADQLVVIKLSFIKDNLEDILLTGVEVADAYKLTGIPIKTVDVDNSSISVELQYFKSQDFVIPTGTKVQTLQKASDNENTGSTIDMIIRAPIKDYDRLQGWAMYSPEVDCAPAYYTSQFKNSTMGVAIQQLNIDGAIQSLTNPDPINALLPYSTHITGPATLDNSTSVKLSSKVDFVGNGSITTANKGFTGIVDRSIYPWFRHSIGDSRLDYTLVKKTIEGYHPVIKHDDNPFSTKVFRYGIGRKDREHEYYNKNNKRPGVAIKYGSYLGLKIETADTTSGVAPMGTMGGKYVLHPSGRVDDIENRNINFESSLTGMTGNFDDTFDSKFAAYTQIFNNSSGIHLQGTNWEERYNDDSDVEYFAISRRYAFTEFDAGLSPVIDLYGGDCYLGLSWKQIWFPLGISEAPQATDVTAYKDDRRNIGMLDFGYSIPVPAQSNLNMHLRVPEIADEVEYKVFGKERTFVPLRTAVGCRGNKQFDTSAYNFGYSDQDVSDNKLFKLSDSAPFYKSLYPNRIYASEPSSNNDFVNGFTQFKSLNFRDYNTELGAITRITTFNDKAVIVFDSGVGFLGINERTQVSTDTGGVYIDNADVLAQKATIISSNYGSTHANSILGTEQYIYGIDISKRKVWRTTGTSLELISDNRIQSLLGRILDELKSFTDVNPTDRWIDVFTSFDVHKGDIIFSFYGKDRANNTFANSIYRTIVFNETQGLNTWICESDDHRKFSFTTRYDRFSFSPVIGNESIFFQYDMNSTFDGNNIFGGIQYDARIEYSVADNPAFEKLYENIWIVGDNTLPDSLSYFSIHGNKIPDISNTQVLSPYTNVTYRMFSGTSPVNAGITYGSKILSLNFVPDIPPPGRTDVFRAGDPITIIHSDGTIYYFTVIRLSGTSLYVDRPAPETKSNFNLYHGYKTILRLTDASIEDGYGKIICQSNNNVNSYDRRLRGKWLITGMDFKGEDQIYINNIVSTYTRSFS